MLDGIDVEVDGAVEGGEEVADAGDAGQPFWPGLASSLKRKYGEQKRKMNDNLQLFLQHVKVPKCLGST